MVKEEIVTLKGNLKLALIRRAPADMFLDLKTWVEKTLKNVDEIKSVSMTDGNGNITLCILYTERGESI